VHEGEEGHARPGWTTSRRGQDSPWKSKSEWQRTGINGESTFMVWPTLGSRTAKEQNMRITIAWTSGAGDRPICVLAQISVAPMWIIASVCDRRGRSHDRTIELVFTRSRSHAVRSSGSSHCLADATVIGACVNNAYTNFTNSLSL